MACPLCTSRKPRRQCPALGATICPVCCGTKRLVTIACPRDCPYLAGAEAHPPAVVRRQRQRDFEFAASLVRTLSDGAYELLFALQDVAARHARTAIPALTDADVAEGCGALAATLETAAKGIIYEHPAHSLPAQRLASDLRAALDTLGKGRPAAAAERDAAEALRRMEAGARTAGAALGEGATAYVAFLERLPRELAAAGGPGGEPPDGAPGGSAGPGSSLILP